MARRLYLGRLPPDARSEDVTKFFDGYGHIVDCRVMTGKRRGPDGAGDSASSPPSEGFGFVEFESSKEAEDALQTFNGKPFMGANIVIEFAKESRPRREPYEERSFGSARSRRPPGIRILVAGISRDTSWQDLKDFGRDAGSVSFSDIDRDIPNQGILEYLSREDAERAVRELDGRELRGKVVRVNLDDSVQRTGPDNYRREERRDDRGGGYRGDDRHDRYDRGGDRSHRRERSRSPAPRRDYEDRRYRSPPPARRDYDDRRPAGYDDHYSRGGYDDRRYPDNDYDRRRDDPRRGEDKRREPRYDDRAPRAPPSGEGSWTR